MVEPITLAGVSSIALTEFIKFLFQQGGEALKRWREKRDGKAALPDKVPVTTPVPKIFEGQLAPLTINLDAVEQLAADLEQFRATLLAYVDDSGRKVDPADQSLLLAAEGMRQAMEAVYQQRLTLQGENRPAPGPELKADIDVETARGRITGIKAALLAHNSDVKIRARTLEKEGEITGIDYSGNRSQ